jgi:molecular chaperone DnaK (HSP70)
VSGRLAVDFGTCNTVVALWDAELESGHTPPLGELTLTGSWQGREFHQVPSLIHYEGERVRAGRQVLTPADLRAHPATFCWMKHYLGQGMRLPRALAGRRVDYFQAGADFLRQVLVAAGGLVDLSSEEVAFTVPVEAFEHYQDWLDEVVRSAGVARPLFLDEPSAAALGYGGGIRPGEAFMVFDFGGGTADATVVRVEPDPARLRCRVLGKAGAQVGGATIDGWIVRHALALGGRAQGRGAGNQLLWEAERVKMALSEGETEDFHLDDPASGEELKVPFTRTALDDLLEENGLFSKLNSVLELAESQATEHGYRRGDLRACLMIGGSSFIPSVRRLLRTRYGEIVRFDRPFDAVALGAAAYASGAGFDDRIRHEYALRPYDRSRGDYVLRTIVPAGTPYPCSISRPDRPEEPLVLTVKASHPDQTRLGLQVYEVARPEAASCGGGGFELVFTENGSARYSPREDVEDFRSRPIGSTTFIQADPPAARGEPRFEARFSIDREKRLCVTVRDLLSGKTLMRDAPLVKLR